MLANGSSIKNYQIEECLGKGSFSCTYSAINLNNNQAVIVKELHFGHLENWKALELFEREAKVLQNIDHPQIPKLIDFFKSDEQDYRLYVVTERVNGHTFSDLLTQGKRFTEKEVRQYAEQLLNILSYLHGLNPPIIHRDIKPSNLILNNDGQVFLIDFGAVQEALIPEGQGGSTIIGTYGYMAPEQFSGRALPSSDLFSIGATLIQLLSGYEPSKIPQKGLSMVFQDLINVNSKFSKWLEKMVEPNPDNRFTAASIAKTSLLKKQELKKSSSVNIPIVKETSKDLEIKKFKSTSSDFISSELNEDNVTFRIEKPLRVLNYLHQKKPIYGLMTSVIAGALSIGLFFNQSHIDGVTKSSYILLFGSVWYLTYLLTWTFYKSLKEEVQLTEINLGSEVCSFKDKSNEVELDILTDDIDSISHAFMAEYYMPYISINFKNGRKFGLLTTLNQDEQSLLIHDIMNFA